MLPVHGFASNSGFSVYYGAYAPLPTCEKPEPEEKKPRTDPKTDMEVQYLYGRNVLGYSHEGGDGATPGDDGNSFDYGWSLKSYTLTRGLSDSSNAE